MSSKPSNSLAAAAVKNPMFQQAAKDAVFEKLSGEEDVESAESFNQRSDTGATTPTDGSVMTISEEELGKIRKIARIMKFSMIFIAIGLFIVSWYNFFSSSSSNFSTTFLAAYLFIFALLICCFEVAFRQAALIIVQNFGFMYTLLGRSVFLSFVAILSFQISTFGKVMFGAILLYGLVSVYVYCKHPQYGKYLRTLHFFNRTKAATAKKGSGGFIV